MVDHKQKVLDWLNADACWRAGVLLFKAFFGANHAFIHLVKKGGSQLKYAILKQALTGYANRIVKQQVKPVEQKQKLREEFAFLNDSDCPAEFKILVADKISAYHNYVSAHEVLFDCTTKAEQLATVKKVVENFIVNRNAHAELEHYKMHGKVLGKHPVFELFKRIQDLRKMKFIDLVKLRKNVDHQIWRNQSEINKGDRPDLYEERIKALEFKKQYLIEIDRIIDQHA